MIILDSSVILAYYNTDDSCHQRAGEIFGDIDQGRYGPVVITDHILHESIGVVERHISRDAAIYLGNILLSSFSLITAGQHISTQAWTMFCRRSHLSITDCSIIVTAEVLEMEYIATFDEEFSRAHSNVEFVGIKKRSH